MPKPLIALYSYHHGNTAKLAQAFAEELSAEVKAPAEVAEGDYGRLVGFGSGIYGEKHHKSLRDLAENLPQVGGKRVFLFSTMGIPFGDSTIQSAIPRSHLALRERLEAKGYVVAGEFSCAGWNTNMFLRYFGGVNKGRPSEADLEKARAFIRGVKGML